MTEAIRHWAITLAYAVILITIVEMLLPDNDIKKYGEFVLGLLLMLIILSPLITLFKSAKDINYYFLQTSDYINDADLKLNLDSVRSSSVKDTKSIFKNKLEKSTTETLSTKFQDKKFSTYVSLISEEADANYTLKAIEIVYSDKEQEVTSIETVTIDGEVSNISKSKTDSVLATTIKKYLGEELGIDISIITVIKK